MVLLMVVVFKVGGCVDGWMRASEGESEIKDERWEEGICRGALICPYSIWADSCPYQRHFSNFKEKVKRRLSK